MVHSVLVFLLLLINLVLFWCTRVRKLVLSSISVIKDQLRFLIIFLLMYAVHNWCRQFYVNIEDRIGHQDNWIRRLRVCLSVCLSVLCCLALSCLVVPRFVLPSPPLTCLALSCLVLSCLVLSCVVLSCIERRWVWSSSGDVNYV